MQDLLVTLPLELKEEMVKYCGRDAFHATFNREPGFVDSDFYLNQIQTYTVQVSCVGIVQNTYRVEVRLPIPNEHLFSNCIWYLEKEQVGYVLKNQIDYMTVVTLNKNRYRLLIKTFDREPLFSEIICGSKSLVSFLKSLSLGS